MIKLGQKRGNLTLNCINTQVNKVALITGGARRIGAAIVQQLHSSGYCVAIHCNTSLLEAQALAQQLNQQRAGSALVIVQDLLQANAAMTLIAAVERHFGQLDVLINNASVFIRTPQGACCAEQWDTLFATNVKTPYFLSIAAYPLLKKQHGCIINISDIHAQRPLKDYAVYCQTKAALNLQTKALARELAPHVRVNAIAPGAIIWPEADNALARQQQEAIINNTPLKKHGSPLYIAQTVEALVINSFITGQIIHVDGGRSIVN